LAFPLPSNPSHECLGEGVLLTMSEDSKVANDRAANAIAQERRKEPRYPFTASAEAVHLQTDTRLSGRVSDLGLGGCYIDTINSFPVGADLKIRIVKGTTSFLAEGRVLYASSGMGMGMAFTKIEPERMQVLVEWLKELRGESSPEARALDDDNVERNEAALGNEPKYVLNELIVALIRKRVLTDREGNALLKRLMR
jgi:hypothetical protein